MTFISNQLAKHLEKYSIVLGSQSPRRRELFSGLNLPFQVRVKDIDEIYPEDMEATLVPEYLALQKSIPFLNDLNDNELIITADTVVIIGQKLLGKPLDYEHAFEMLQTLSGNKHIVVTGVCITTSIQQKTFADRTEVYFKKLTKHEIDYYLTCYHPYDKAGAYGVQEWIGYIAIEKIIGSYFNVMGLPIQMLYNSLLEF